MISLPLLFRGATIGGMAARSSALFDAVVRSSPVMKPSW